MLHTKSFVKKTKRGQVLRVVREHYVRDDIESGSPLDPQCGPENVKLSADANHYLVVDTNVVLHQLDFLEHKSICDVIILSTVLQEVRSRNSSAYTRLQELLRNSSKRFFYFSNEYHKDTYVKQLPGETPNDRNDRAIRVATQWYMQRVVGKPIILVTADAKNREAAVAEGLHALSVEEYASTQISDSDIMDVVSRGVQEGDVAADDNKKKRKKVYKEHLSFSAVHSGIKAGRLHQGTIRVSQYSPFEGYVTLFDKDQNVLIKGREDMNRAFDGDTVAIELLPKEQWQSPSARLPSKPASSNKAGTAAADDDEIGPVNTEARVAPEADADPESSGKRPTGRVVGIMKRNWRVRGYAGSLKEVANLKQGRTMSVLFAPVERRIPYIRIQTRQAGQLMDKRIAVVVDDWPPDSLYPTGHYIRTLGQIGDLATETEVLLLEWDVNTAPFTPAVHDCVPPLPWSVSQADHDAPYREDLRGVCVCSVDPPGCKDIDDALHARPLPNGNVELGVHIADVTHFVQPGSAMDEEAARRSTTVYLVQRRIDMLPKPLTEDICSLRGGVERLAFSVIWEVTPDAEVISTRFTKSIIKSRAAMTYQEAQTKIDDERLDDELTRSLRTMMRISKILKKRRYEAGALNLASPEVKFTIDTETNSPLDVGMYQLRDTNSMVEEMMLLANITVAKHIQRAFPACAMLRRHETPTPSRFEPLLQAASACGFQVKTDTSKMLADSLDRAVRDDDPYFNKLIRIMATRCMTQAKYFTSGEVATSEYLHYGLAAPIYTHFTSPIRRYADVVVHRLLAASLGLIPLPESIRDRSHMQVVVDNMNERHHNAQMAGRSSVQLHTVIFFRDRRVVADARVVQVKANGLVVFVPKYGIEGPVFFGGAEDDRAGSAPGTTLNEERQEVTLAGGQKYKLFDKVAVNIFVEKGTNHRERMVVQLVDRAQLKAEEKVT